MRYTSSFILIIYFNKLGNYTDTLRHLSASNVIKNATWSSLGGVPKTCKSKEFNIRLKFAKQSKYLFSFTSNQSIDISFDIAVSCYSFN
jgi:hypothetical protein